MPCRKVQAPSGEAPQAERTRSSIGGQIRPWPEGMHFTDTKTETGDRAAPAAAADHRAVIRLLSRGVRGCTLAENVVDERVQGPPGAPRSL